MHDWNSNGMEEIIYRLETRHRPLLLTAMMRALAAEDCKISFEVALSQTELAQMEGVAHEQTGVLKRGTLWPKFDFLVLPLTQQYISAIEKAIESKISFRTGIRHVQIERNGKMAFAAYDNFQHVVAYSAVSSAQLDDLTETRVLWSYTQAILKV
jgi:hypothetical protein